MVKFIILAAGAALILYAATLAGQYFQWFTKPSFTGTIILFLTFSTIGLYVFIARQLSLHPADFVKFYLGATVLRILFFGGFIFVLIKFDPAGAWKNSILFLVGYVLLTSLEIFKLFMEINFRQSPKE